MRCLTARERSVVLDGIDKHLLYEPFTEARNRKELRPNPLAPWELRLGSLRVFYDSDPLDSDVIRILAVGAKKGNRLHIAGEEIQL